MNQKLDRMKKKTKKPKTKTKDDVSASVNTPIVPAEAGEQGNPFDFGGLKARDLKKNLGCG